MFRAIPVSSPAVLVRIVYPMVPNALTASVDIADPMRVLITLSLPGDAIDVWGVEIRDTNNSTVLYSYKNILLSVAKPDDPALIWTWANSLGSPVRTKTLYAYAFNLLGERSAQYQINISIPTPSLSGLAVDETAETLAWVGANATQYQVEIATDSGFTSIVFNTKQTDEFIALDEASLLLQRWFRVTPRDVLGAGTAVTTNHVVTPGAPTSLDPTGTGAGAFQFKWATAASPVKPASLLYRVTIASDSGFTANVESFADIQALSLNVQRPNLARFWKVEAKYAGGSYGTAAVYGAPTAVTSGLVDLGGDVTGDIDDIPDGGTYGRTRGDVLSAGRVRFLRRSDAADIDTDNVFRKNVETGDAVLDGASKRVPTLNEATGGGRGYTNIASDGTYAPVNYHKSAVRVKATTNRDAGTVGVGSWVDGASWSIQVPPNKTTYGGTVTVSRITAGGATNWTAHGRIRVGTNYGTVIDVVSPATSASGAVVISGLTPDSLITVVVQLWIESSDGAPEFQSRFGQVQYTDQDAEAF